jgi:hypothetical protein
MGVQPIGALLAGGLAKRVGAPHTLSVFGSVVLLGSLVFVSKVAVKAGPVQRTSQA